MEKICPCCGRRYDAESWEQLESVAFYGYRGEASDWRNCPCGATLVIPLYPWSLEAIAESQLELNEDRHDPNIR